MLLIVCDVFFVARCLLRVDCWLFVVCFFCMLSAIGGCLFIAACCSVSAVCCVLLVVGVVRCLLPVARRVLFGVCLQCVSCCCLLFVVCFYLV